MMGEIWSLIALVGAVSLLVVCITHCLMSRRMENNVNLPPGSMGLPLVGETIQLFGWEKSTGIHPFIKKRVARYGPVFKTSVVRRSFVISVDPEFSHFIFQQEGNSVEQYIPFIEDFKMNIEKHNLNIHKYVRNLVLSFFGTDKNKETLLSEMEHMARTNIAIWSELPSIELREVSATMAFGLAWSKLFGNDYSKDSENLLDIFNSCLRSFSVFPLNIPGTAYHKCCKDREKGMNILREKVKERMSSPPSEARDFLDVMIDEMKQDQPVFDTEAVSSLMFLILLAGFETMSLSLTLAVKFISENPATLKDLMDEHEIIRRNRENVESAITWNEYKSMTFTAKVIDETLRLGNISPLMFRRSTRDIQVNGYTIPSGWGIIVYPPAIHLNPDNYEDPLAFNPWRWKGKGSNTSSKCFMPFGGGMRLCAGSGYTKMGVAITLHFLVTKYRWTKIKGGQVNQKFQVEFPNGLHVKVTKNN